MKVLCTGSNGYVGSALVPYLLAAGHEVVGFDTQWFHVFPEMAGLTQIKGDIRDVPAFTKAVAGCDATLHLGCISNDTSCALDESLSTEINFKAFEPIVVASKLMGVKRFIYCSSSSVYGVSDAPDVTEEHPLVPLTLYNRYKGACEPLLLKHATPIFTPVILRPATVCGYAPRQRFDLTINILTMHAIMKKEITVFGGKQRRPNLHIADMCRVYKTLLEAPEELVAGETFNVGAENMSLNEAAALVRKVVLEEMGIDAPIVNVAHTDDRSYHINSDKILRVLGFAPEFDVARAIRDLCDQFKEGNFKDALTNPIYLNVKQLIELGVK